MMNGEMYCGAEHDGERTAYKGLVHGGLGWDGARRGTGGSRKAVTRSAQRDCTS